MTTTAFVPGTTITSPWLNDVDTKTYRDTSDTVAYTPAGTGAVATTVQAKLRESVSVLDFGAVGDGVTDDTAAVALAVAAANLIGVASGGYCRLEFPDGTYLIDSLLVKSNIWFDLGGAVLKKRTNGLGIDTNCLIRAVETLTGATYYGTYEKIKITGGFLDANGKTGGASLVRLLFVDGLDIDGVTVLSHIAANWALCLGGRHGNVRNCTILGGSDLFEDGIHVVHGSNWRIENNYVESGDDAIALGSAIGDIYLSADPEALRYVTVSNNVVKSEKAYAFKIYVESGATGTDWEISDVVVNNLSGKSGITRNGGIWLDDANTPAAGTSQIQRVSISNVALDLGSTTHTEINQLGIYIRSVLDCTLSNVFITLTDTTVSTTGFVLCTVTSSQNITLEGIQCPATTRRGAFALTSSNNITLSKCRVKQTSASVSNLLDFDDVVNLRVLDCDFLDIQTSLAGIAASGGTTTTLTARGNKFTGAAGVVSYAFSIGSTQCDYADISDNDFSGVAVSILSLTSSFGRTPTISINGNRSLSTESLKAKLFDDFLGDVLADEWSGRVGSDPQCVTPTITLTSTAPGLVRLTTGDDAGATMALNGSQLESTVSWNPIYDGLVFETKLRISAITDVCVFAGFTDQAAALEMPFTLAAGNALTSNASNAVGILFDTAADTDKWWLVGVAADVDATKQDVNVAPVASTHEVWRIEVLSTGAASFFRNGAKIGTAMTGAVASNVGLTPVICAFSRTTASRDIDADYVLVEQNRP